MNLTQLQPLYIEDLAKKTEEFKRLFQTGGVCYVITASQFFKEDKSSLSNYDWCPFENELEIKNISGETVFCQDKNAGWLFKSIKFEWKAIFSRFPENINVLATNRAGDPISIIVPYDDGFCVFLPYTDDTDKLLNMLFERGINLIPEKEQIATETVPPWANEYMTENELKLFTSFREIEKKLGKYTKFKALLWETGPNLENLVISLFEEIGIKVDKLSPESHADFECPLSADLTGVFEVKGLSGNADRRNMRQLLDYFVEQRDIELRNVKGIFIITHFKDKKPSERRKPATKDAYDLARKHNFVIMPTTKLYELFVHYLEKRLSKEEFLRQFTMD